MSESAQKMAIPRKFSEKIALQKQKQAEGTAEFEKIMKEVHATKMDETQPNQKILEYCLGNAVDSSSAISSSKSGGGSGAGSGASGGGASPEGTAGGGGGGGSPTAYRESRGRSVGVGPMRRPNKQDRSPYGSSTNTNAIGVGSSSGAYLSPPMDNSWRRSNSDSALHQSLNMAIAGESGFGAGGVSGVGGMHGGLNSLHADYQHHHHQGQRSQSPNIGRSFSPQAPRRKGNLMQQQQQQFLEHHLKLQQQQQIHQNQQQMQQQHMHMQQQQQSSQQQPHQTQQQSPNYNAKFLNCNNMPAANSLFKSLQEQAMPFANTGSLPDLTSVHYAQQPPPQHHQQLHHQQQHTLSPVLSPHNSGRDRDQSPSPFSPTGSGGNGGPPSPYHQQQHSPTSAANTPTAAQTSSPHLSFTNLSVQSPTPTTQTGSFGNLTTLGAASSTGNLTDYRQPLNPPSPGSSPGLLTSVTGNELHASAPASPTRHPQTSLQQSLQSYNDKNIQTFDRYSPNNAASSGAAGNIDSSYNSLNTFHNHFEQFSLGDSNSSPDQQHFQTNSFAALEFDDFVSSAGVSGGSHAYSQSLVQNKLLDFSDMNSAATVGSPTNATAVCNNNNNLQQQSGRSIDQQQQRLLNNNAANSNGPHYHPSNNNGAGGGSGGGNLSQHSDATTAASPIPSPLAGCLPSPSSPLPIPIPSQQTQHHHQQQHPQNHHHHHQMSLSLHSQHSPHHSPMHSPHHTSSSPLSASSPGGVSPMGCTNALSPSPSPVAPTAVSTSTHASNAVNPAATTQQQSQQQNHAANTPTANIPSIIFSDYSSNSDFSREIFDTLDLDLGQIDVAGLQMLSDQNTIMIADPSIEDSFRRDLN